MRQSFAGGAAVDDRLNSGVHACATAAKARVVHARKTVTSRPLRTRRQDLLDVSRRGLLVAAEGGKEVGSDNLHHCALAELTCKDI